MCPFLFEALLMCPGVDVFRHLVKVSTIAHRHRSQALLRGGFGPTIKLGSINHARNLRLFNTVHRVGERTLTPSTLGS
jgi:hypothetical protein